VKIISLKLYLTAEKDVEKYSLVAYLSVF